MIPPRTCVGCEVELPNDRTGLAVDGRRFVPLCVGCGLLVKADDTFRVKVQTAAGMLMTLPAAEVYMLRVIGRGVPGTLAELTCAAAALRAGAEADIAVARAMRTSVRGGRDS